ncbi:hypothetical protein [Burkholderia sp. Bp8990]|uniref:hypothetical protein n=1 Tax=Burkholderia sp. Bp8990 TaxID=2184552 RepID=UPI000F5B3A73|nr:hypothetical protein [Burkholderia sp. Bp8990]RQS39792.1 hypothetical protein DIE01_16405 [Burkholderia sp. Bp8990]
MADIEQFSDGPVVTGIVKFYEKLQFDAPAYLSGETAGEPCPRAVWYAYHWCERPVANGVRTRLKNLQLGAVRRMLAELRDVVAEVHDNDGTGPFRLVDHSGHFGSTMHAAAHGVPGGGDQWHVVEVASLGPAAFGLLKTHGVQAVCGQQYDRMQLHMGWSDMPRALFVAENSADAELFAERVKFDPVYFEKLRVRAESVIFAAEPPPRLYDDPTEDTCRACPAHVSCHGTRVPAMSCRTCCYATPERQGDARWSCCHPAGGAPEIPLEVQRTGCNEHLVLPFLVNYAAVEEAGQDGWIVFKRRDTGRHFVVASATAMPPADMFAHYDAPQLYHSADLSNAIDDKVIG